MGTWLVLAPFSFLVGMLQKILQARVAKQRLDRRHRSFDIDFGRARRTGCGVSMGCDSHSRSRVTRKVHKRTIHQTVAFAAMQAQDAVPIRPVRTDPDFFQELLQSLISKQLRHINGAASPIRILHHHRLRAVAAAAAAIMIIVVAVANMVIRKTWFLQMQVSAGLGLQKRTRVVVLAKNAGCLRMRQAMLSASRWGEMMHWNGLSIDDKRLGLLGSG